MIIEKTYLCTWIGTGTLEDPYRPRLADETFPKNWFAHRLKQHFKGKKWCLITIVAEETDHDTIILEEDEVLFADKRVVLVDVDTLKSRFPLLPKQVEAFKKSSITFSL